MDILRLVRSEDLSATDIEQSRALLWRAFEHDENGAMTEEDWQHSLGGTHFLLDRDGTIVSLAAVVTRDIHFDGVPLKTAYVEAVATEPGFQGQGLGTRVMRAVGDFIDGGDWQIGGLATSSHHFYERLGWRTWRGHAFVRTKDGEVATPDEDGYLLFRLTPRSPALRPDAPISCEWRPGDVW